MTLPKLMLAAAVAALFLPPVAGLASAAETATLSSPQQLNSLIATVAQRHGLEADYGLRLKAEHPALQGKKVTRLHHTYKGVRIVNSESVVVSDAAGAIVSESTSDFRHGVAGINLTPVVTAKQAIDLSVNALAPHGSHVVLPTAELVIYPVVQTRRKADSLNKAEQDLNALDMEDVVVGHTLAYLVQTRMVAQGQPVYHDSLISALDGHVLARKNALHNVIGVGHSQYYGDVPLSTTFANGVYQLLDTTRGVGGTFGGMAVLNANHGASGGTIFANTTNVWGDGKQYGGGITTSPNGETAAVDAMYTMASTYDLLSNVVGWKGLDGKNTSTYIAVHVNTAYANAFYDGTCKCMYIGDGDGGVYTDLATLDIVGHELGHGVNEATANLGLGEAGGLNESSSDITGEMVEAYAKGGGKGNVVPATGNDWVLGKEATTNGAGLRNMYKPSKDGLSPDAWNSRISSLDIHYGAGPNNRMFYFLSQGSSASASSDFYSPYLKAQPAAMTGIGNDHAFRIWFHALSTKFTSSTNYASARTLMVASAQELYGVGSKEDIAVQRAYAAINVGADVNESGPVPHENMINGGFESGSTGWTASANVIGNWSSRNEPAKTGLNSAWLGGNGKSGTEALSQKVTLPAAATSATLTFDLHIDTAETGSTAYDKLNITVKNAAGSVLKTLATFNNTQAAAGYVHRSYDLSAYRGQSVTISFSATEDSSRQTSFVVDNVSLLSQ